MEILAASHRGNTATARRMYGICENYYQDLGRFLGLPLGQVFDYVRSIPYAEDEIYTGSPWDEIIARAKYLTNPKIFPALDCKKKSILLGSWCAGQVPPVPFRFIGLSEIMGGEIHHVFPQIQTDFGWVNFDATLPDYEIGQGKQNATAAVAF